MTESDNKSIPKVEDISTEKKAEPSINKDSSKSV